MHKTAKSIFMLLWVVAIGLCVEKTAQAQQKVLIIASNAGIPELRLRKLEASLQAIVADQTSNSIITSANASTLMSKEPNLAQMRKAATELLAEAKPLVENQQYEEALNKLDEAENAASQGLARFFAPQLLADIYLERGLTTLLTDRHASQKWLVQSFLLWPERQIDSTNFAPKVQRDLEAARAEARHSLLSGPKVEETNQLAALCQANLILLIMARHLGPEGQEQISLRVFDVKNKNWRQEVNVVWPISEEESRIQSALQSAISSLLPGARGEVKETKSSDTRPGAPKERGSTSTWAAKAFWTSVAAGAVSLIAGGVFTYLARDRLDEAESLAHKNPPLEYAHSARDWERASRRWEIAGIACYSVSAVAVISAAAFAIKMRNQKNQSQTWAATNWNIGWAMEAGPSAGSLRLQLNY